MKDVPISVVAISKNENENIRRFITSIRDAFSGHPVEIVVDDTGSDDGTREVIGELADVTGDFKWVSDFSKARNHSLSLVSNKWVLVLDCDEFVTYAYWNGLQRFIQENPRAVGRLERKNRTVDEKGTPSIYRDEVERFFDRNLYHYTGSIHEQVRPRDDAGVSMSWGKIPLTVDHVGYALSPEKMREKAERDLELLLKELEQTPGDPYICFQIGQSMSVLGDKAGAADFYEMAINADPDPRLEYVQMLIVAYGYTLTDLGRNEDALSLAALYEEFGGVADYVCLMGLIYLRNGMLEDAVREYERACGIVKSFSEGANTYIPRYNLGIIREMSGNVREAEKMYRACGEYGPALNRLKLLKQR
ncbi:MAG: glycosyltransferase [Lachnospiraceae bacterium]|nr:glycosyltransferase [Lachnospiraceae bacterium]